MALFYHLKTTTTTAKPLFQHQPHQEHWGLEPRLELYVTNGELKSGVIFLGPNSLPQTREASALLCPLCFLRTLDLGSTCKSKCWTGISQRQSRGTVPTMGPDPLVGQRTFAAWSDIRQTSNCRTRIMWRIFFLKAWKGRSKAGEALAGWSETAGGGHQGGGDTKDAEKTQRVTHIP